MKCQALDKTNTSLARPVAPEDLQRGTYVALLSELIEFPSFLWCCDAHLLPTEEPVRVKFYPLRPGLPLRVVEICLPFVLVEAGGGERFSLDVRQCQLARLKKRFAKAAGPRKSRGKRGKRAGGG